MIKKNGYYIEKYGVLSSSVVVSLGIFIYSECKGFSSEITNQFLTLRITIESKVTSLENKMDARFTALESKVETKFTALESKLDAKIAALESKVDAKITQLDGKIESKKLAWLSLF
jgi:outer membrane murein-binding lipoprotein Lpp